ncbi:hypothetical protein PCIT_a4324 [Pseudoalteromonas citrea]|uniref:Fibronectin type-III domain-containing protein n=3 Tax=Pseudoalteromonas citrea TaxID=43655 RepID=A0AAD4AIK9_9GAMM|nr:hypothetical protein PCIT_a4324 [Pseudoalteromonas citrea]
MKFASSHWAKLLLGPAILLSQHALGATLPDVCATQGPSTSITDGTPICVNDNGTAYLSLSGVNEHNSVAISTGHGNGDLSLYVDQGRWPNTGLNSNAYKSITSGTNGECVVISNPSQYWLMIAVTGNRSKSSIAVDFGATSCRDVNGGGDNPGDGNTGSILAPSNLAGTTTESSATVSWSDNSNNEDNFIVQRSSAGISWHTVATVNANETSFTDTGLVQDKVYYYVMYAKNTTNTSAWSAILTTKTKKSGSTTPPGDGDSGDLANMCATSAPTTETALTDGVPVCVPATSQRKSFSISTFNKNVTSIAISSSYGLGNLTLAGRTDGTWPKSGDDSIRSPKVGNTECVILTNPQNGWNNVSLEGLFKGASVVADFNKTSCRVTPGADDPGNDGYDHNGVHVLVYPFRFPDQDLAFSTEQINAEMQKTKDFFTEQSYGKFNFTWEIKPKITMPQSHNYYNNDKKLWNPGYKEQLVNAGVDPNFPGDATIIMVTAPPIGNDATYFINSQAGPPLMEIYTYAAGTIAHETGHALGLHHSMSIEGGNSMLNGNSNDVVTNYGNVFGLMGMGAHSLEEMNLMYKGYFNNWISDTDVPTITTSGKYRIYTYNHGTSSGHNAPGAIGLKIPSGDKTFWVEYLTRQKSEANTPPDQQLRTPLLQNGIVINLQNYMDNNAAPWYNHNSLLLDSTPNSRSSNWALEDFNDAPLQKNHTFTDPWGKFSIYPIETGGTLGTANAWIDVQVTFF